MGSSFDRWEKDPFFSVAEEVQESADRMESTYRTWIHFKRDASSMWNSEELCRDLRTALGTTKWQLEEFERAVKSSHGNSYAEDARDRHREFIIAIKDQISRIESSLKHSALEDGKPPLSWVRLDEGESNELALFLSGSSTSEDTTMTANYVRDSQNLGAMGKELEHGVTKSSCQSTEHGSLEVKAQKSHGHRRTASASADIGSWNIIIDDGYPTKSSVAQLALPPRKVPSVPVFLNNMGTVSKLKLPKNGFRKWKLLDHQETDSLLVESSQLPQGNTCYERSKNCLDSCDDCYDKPLYGWYGALHRQLQRSQYQMQYNRPVQVFLWISCVCLIGFLVLRAI